MTKNESRIKDIRSTGRRRARLTLFRSRRDFKCVDCGKTTTRPPEDAPAWFDEIWPLEKREVTQLQADHETKDLLDNDESLLEWRCPSCHKIHDSTTAVGESTIRKDYF